MAEHEGAEAGVADRADVGTGIAQAEQGAWVHQHLAHGVERALVVIEDRKVHQAAAVARAEVVVQRLQRAAAALFGPHQKALHHVGLVVQAVIQREHAPGNLFDARQQQVHQRRNRRAVTRQALRGLAKNLVFSCCNPHGGCPFCYRK